MSLYPTQILQRLRDSRKVAVLTGSGISAESGISTFRGAGGLWENFNPLELATPEAFIADPKKVWEWYEARRRQIRDAQPNEGHQVLAWMETFFPQVTLLTQNVDRLHQKAGSRNPLELHGSLWMMRCVGKSRPNRGGGPDVSGTGGCGEWEDRHELKDLPPHCPQCGALVRPGVVWFGESLAPEIWLEAEKASNDCDAFLIIGTSALVYPAASLPEGALRRGKPVVEINPEETSLSSRVTLSIRSKASEALLELRESLLRAPE